MVSQVETNPADFSAFAPLHALLSDAFAYMAAWIDPPSSMTRLTVDGVEDKARTEDLFVVREDGRPVACLFGTPTDDAYYIGKLAVTQSHRGQGLARALVEAAAARARDLNLHALELQSRVELVENHATFAALGFVEIGRTAHAGYDRPTSITFRRPLPRGPA
ncbi:GNAT family N-acetyltransferase [Roseibacterium sp. SDUM158016]|uniref:GNAT family N-acetyltransferase n=1 Tax=Roseicyclus sediminis TaxID=2980997 RepID=UPI0021CF65B9|nr:GNAT family N-acetyltransferase [Roseibacterium sp. SDUM158016]MCU4651927.1 GNAT family N-acetyltransferase [Roseibacterium sp. SDUM158016]